MPLPLPLPCSPRVAPSHMILYRKFSTYIQQPPNQPPPLTHTHTCSRNEGMMPLPLANTPPVGCQPGSQLSSRLYAASLAWM